MRKRAKNQVETKVQVYVSPGEMKRGVKRLTRRGWRVASTTGKFNYFSLFGYRDQVTVVFEKLEDEAANAVDPQTANAGGPQTPTVASPTRNRFCPKCSRPMNGEARVCPHCRSYSSPWIHHAGFWWARSETSDRWQWLDETANIFRWYPEGTPSVPSATTDQTPSRALDPDVISPPGTDPPVGIERQGAIRASSPSAELERLADLHARGVLTDEEFQQAKQQVLKG